MASSQPPTRLSAAQAPEPDSDDPSPREAKRIHRAVKAAEEKIHQEIILDQIKEVRGSISVLAKEQTRTATSLVQLQGDQSTMVELLKSIDANITRRTEWERIDREARAKVDAEVIKQESIAKANREAADAEERSERAKWMRKIVEKTGEWVASNWKVVAILMLLLPGNLDAAARLGILPEPLATLLAGTAEEGSPVRVVEETSP